MAPNQHTTTSIQPDTLLPTVPLQSLDGALLALREGPEDVVTDAVRVVQALSANIPLRYMLVQAGVAQLLIDRLATCTSPSVRLAVIRTLHPFSAEKGVHTKLESTGIIPTLLRLLTSSTRTIDDSSEALRLLQLMLVDPGLLAEFVRLDGLSIVAAVTLGGSDLIRDRALFVLWMLAAHPVYRLQFPQTKALDALMSILEQSSGESIDITLSALALLTENEECRNAMVTQGILTVLPRVLQSEPRDEVIYRAKLVEELLVPPQAP